MDQPRSGTPGPTPGLERPPAAPKKSVPPAPDVAAVAPVDHHTDLAAAQAALQERDATITALRASEATLLGANRRLREALDEQATAQQQVVQRERLRALGEMASSIAHDFNNALSPVLGFTELLLADPTTFGQQPKMHRYLELVYAGAQDAARIVNRLREFYRRRASDDVSQPVDVGPLLQQVVTLTQPTWRDAALAAGRTIHVAADLPGVPPVAGSAEELRQAVTNLVLNAADAMPAGGTITLRARSTDRHVTISVADTGTGMTEEVLRRCLEPFFTTRAQPGRGLGLSIVYGAVHRHGGEVHVETSAGNGTTISLRLPISRPQPDDAAAGSDVP